MRYSSFLLFYLLFFTNFNLSAQSNCFEDILGRWYAPGYESSIKFYADENDQLNGKLDWMKKEYKNGKIRTDHKNPVDSLKNRPIKGIDVVFGLKCVNGKEFKKGEIYDLRYGKTYSCNLKIIDENTIELRGYLYKPIFGKTVYYYRDADDRM